LALVTAAFAAPQEPFRSAPPEVEEALRARISAFYGLFQQGQMRQAEAYVAEESRDIFYNAPKARIIGHEIRDVEFNADLNEANVLVAVQTLTAFAKQAVTQPLQSKWKLVDGQWYLSINPIQAGESYKTPVGDMHFSQDGGPGSPPLGFQRPDLSTMQKAYEISERVLRFASSAKEPVTQTVTVKNKFENDLTIDRLTRDFPGMEIRIASEVVPKDGETTISFTYNPEAALLVGNKNFEFELMPITQRVRIVMAFR
jgi:hypothetical protein